MKTLLPSMRIIRLIAILCLFSANGKANNSLSDYLTSGHSLYIHTKDNVNYLTVYETNKGINSEPLFEKEWENDMILGVEFDRLDIQSWISDHLLFMEDVTLTTLTINPAIEINMKNIKITNELDIKKDADVTLKVERQSGMGTELAIDVERINLLGKLILRADRPQYVEAGVATQDLIRIVRDLVMTKEAVLKDLTGAIRQALVDNILVKNRTWEETMFLSENGEKYLPVLFTPATTQPALPGEQIRVKKIDLIEERENWEELINELSQDLYNSDSGGLKLGEETGKAGEYCVELENGNVLFTNYIRVKGALTELAEKILITGNDSYKKDEDSNEEYFNGIIQVKDQDIIIATPILQDSEEKRKMELTLLNSDVNELTVEKNVELNLILQDINEIKKIKIEENSTLKLTPQVPEKAKPTEKKLATENQNIADRVERTNDLQENESLRLLNFLKILQNSGGLGSNNTIAELEEKATIIDNTGLVNEVTKKNAVPKEEPAGTPATTNTYRNPNKAVVEEKVIPANEKTNTEIVQKEDVENKKKVDHELVEIEETTAMPVPNQSLGIIQKWPKIQATKAGNDEEDTYVLSFTPTTGGFYRIMTTIEEEEDNSKIVFMSPLMYVLPDPNTAGSVHHTITLETGSGITVNYPTGDLTVSENDYLYLDFLTDTEEATAAEILFLVDGVETPFKTSSDNRGGGYILNPITKDHRIVIALRQYPVTIPEVDGAIITPSAGIYPVAYGEPFRFTIEPKDLNDFKDLKVFTNGFELAPDETGQAQSLQYTIDAINTPISITIEGLTPTSNVPITTTPSSIYVSNGMLVVDSSSATWLSVLTPTGQLYTTRQIPAGTTRIALPAGVYIVRTEDIAAKKVVVQ